MTSLPPFSLKSTRYDMDSFWGRAQHFYAAVDPRHALHSRNDIFNALKKMDSMQSGYRAPEWTDEELWKARAICEGCVHPATKEILPAWVRMSAFIPINMLIVPYMLLPGTIASVPRTVFIHWVNQSYNSAVNYANRSSDAVPVSTLVQGYGAAVSVSMTGALGATFLMRGMKDKASPRATMIRALVPFCSVAFAGGANVAMMRMEEWNNKGVAVVDDEGVERGKSNAAGKIGVLKCAAARFLWNLPVMLLPPLLLMPIAKQPFFTSNPVRLVMAETLACVAGMSLGVAPALAAFKPVDRVAVSRLEPEFQNLRDSKGQKIEYLSFYKGL